MGVAPRQKLGEHGGGGPERERSQRDGDGGGKGGPAIKLRGSLSRFERGEEEREQKKKRPRVAARAPAPMTPITGDDRADHLPGSSWGLRDGPGPRGRIGQAAGPSPCFFFPFFHLFPPSHHTRRKREAAASPLSPGQCRVRGASVAGAGGERTGDAAATAEGTAAGYIFRTFPSLSLSARGGSPSVAGAEVAPHKLRLLGRVGGRGHGDGNVAINRITRDSCTGVPLTDSWLRT